jgi:Flp pilus assembly protein TadD
VRALLRLGPVTGDAASRAALGRYLDQLLQPASAERVNQLIYRLLRAEASAEAERAAKYLLSLDGKSPYYLDTLAEVFHLRGDAKEALRLSSQALASAPKGSELLRQSLLQNHAPLRPSQARAPRRANHPRRRTPTLGNGTNRRRRGGRAAWKVRR